MLDWIIDLLLGLILAAAAPSPPDGIVMHLDPDPFADYILSGIDANGDLVPGETPAAD